MKRSFGLLLVLVVAGLAPVAEAQMRRSNGYSYRASRIEEAIIKEALREALSSHKSLEGFMPSETSGNRRLTQGPDGMLGEFMITSSFKNCNCKVVIRRVDIGDRTDMYSFATTAAKEWARQLTLCDEREVGELVAKMNAVALLEAKQHLATLNSLPAGHRLMTNFAPVRFRGDVIAIQLIAQTSDGSFQEEFQVKLPREASSVEEAARLAMQRAVKKLADRPVSRSTRK